VKVGDFVKIKDSSEWYEIYGEVYRPKYRNGFYAGPWHDGPAAIEIYENGIVSEVRVEDVTMWKINESR
jgi:hypothetical protein